MSKIGAINNSNFVSASLIVTDQDNVVSVQQPGTGDYNFDILVGTTYTALKPIVGDVRLQDKDDIDDSDYIQFKVDDGLGKVEISSPNNFEFQHDIHIIPSAIGSIGLKIRDNGDIQDNIQLNEDGSLSVRTGAYPIVNLGADLGTALLQFNNAYINALNLVTLVVGSIEIGGGYGFTGTTIDTDGNIQMNGKLTVDGAIDPTELDMPDDAPVYYDTLKTIYTKYDSVAVKVKSTGIREFAAAIELLDILSLDNDQKLYLDTANTISLEYDSVLTKLSILGDTQFTNTLALLDTLSLEDDKKIYLDTANTISLEYDSVLTKLSILGDTQFTNTLALLDTLSLEDDKKIYLDTANAISLEYDSVLTKLRIIGATQLDNTLALLDTLSLLDDKEIFYDTANTLYTKYDSVAVKVKSTGTREFANPVELLDTLGLDDDKEIYLDTANTKSLKWNSAGGYVELNDDLVAVNYPVTNDMAFEVMAPDSLVNAQVNLVYELTVGGVANKKGSVYKILATAAGATGSLTFQYKVPSDYRGMIGTADIAADIAGFDAVGGPGVIGTLAFSVFEETNGVAINTITAVQNINGGNAADDWTDIAALAAGVDDIADGSGVGAGEKLILKIDFSIPIIADYIKISLPDQLYTRIA